MHLLNSPAEVQCAKQQKAAPQGNFPCRAILMQQLAAQQLQQLSKT
jgi:hypothetical protein